MKKHITNIFSLLSLIVLLTGSTPASSVHRATREERIAVERIQNEILLIQGDLAVGKALQYAYGIYHASRRFDIDPHLLIAIAKRETDFREDLPEGKAGELGICQIRKMWVKNLKFLSVFKTAKRSDLLIPAKNFMFAAWILKDLKDTKKRNTIPYWSYYNSVKFHNRFRYFVGVNRHLSTLKFGNGSLSRTIATVEKKADVKEARYWIPDMSPKQASVFND